MPAKEGTIATPAKPQPTPHQQAVPAPASRVLDRVADEVNRIFDDFGLGRGFSRVATPGDVMTWTPRVDITQHNNELLIRADLPGLEKNDVKVNVTEDAITIHGERHRAQEEERDGVYRSERSYGAFYRSIALPPGTMTDQAKASFKNGVLEIRMPAAPGAEGKPLEIA